MSEAIKLQDFVNCQGLLNSHLFPENPFDLLGKNLTQWLNAFLDELGVKDEPIVLGERADGAYISGRVYVGKTAVIEPTAFIQGPAFIGEGSEVRHGAYIRGSVYVGKDCIVGHVTEVKGSVFFDGAKAGHLSYVGDSLLGREVNLGAGTKLANLKLKGNEVRYLHPQTMKPVNSGLRKFGSILGDHAQTGCNAVLSPGTLLLPKTLILPCTHFQGTK